MYKFLHLVLSYWHFFLSKFLENVNEVIVFLYSYPCLLKNFLVSDKYSLALFHCSLMVQPRTVHFIHLVAHLNLRRTGEDPSVSCFLTSSGLLPPPWSPDPHLCWFLSLSDFLYAYSQYKVSPAIGKCWDLAYCYNK